MGGKTLQGAGKISHQDALIHAEAEYTKYRIHQTVQASEVEAVYLETLKKAHIEGKDNPDPSRKRKVK